MKWRAATTGERIISGALCAVVAGTCVWLAVADPVGPGFAPKCFSYQLTGMLCPGCGSSRALHALLHGQPARACGFNPLLVIASPFLAAWIALQAIRALWGRHLLAGRPRAILGYGFLIALIAYTIARNLPGPAFDVLRPPGPERNGGIAARVKR